jgi:two-component system chemotaxis sensor kinase CheA
MTVDVWQRFVSDGSKLATALDEGVASIAPDDLDDEQRERVAALGFDAFSIACQGLLVGAEDVANLALACERALDLVAAHELNPAYVIPVLVSSTHTLRQAFSALANPDNSGARTDGIPLEAARFELETFFSGHKNPAAINQSDVPVSSLTKARPTPVETSVEPKPEEDLWTPNVDEDMVALFFEEVKERLDALSETLLDLENRPDDADLVGEVFRDLHTIKGSSALVGLKAMNSLAHAAEDLVGQVREGQRGITSDVIDALLAAVDALRDIGDTARARLPIKLHTAPIMHRLRNPEATPSVPAASAAAEAPQPPHRDRPQQQTIRVDFDKLDVLMNLVGELVLDRENLRTSIGSLSSLVEELGADKHLSRRLGRLATSKGGDLEGVGAEIGRLERVMAEIAHELDGSTDALDSVSGQLREQVMKLRMIPVAGILRKHHRTVRDLGNATGKRVRLELSGEDTELDKLLVEALDEPLLHLVRNAVDHGIETPEERAAAGKAAEGLLEIRAHHRGNQVLLEISDDGKGIDADIIFAKAVERGLTTENADLSDREKLELIFRPGFSTAANVSEISGRGVGMDVVREIIISRLKGSVDVHSEPGQGTRFVLHLPLTLAIIQVLFVRAAGELFALPIDSLHRTTTCTPDDLVRMDAGYTLTVRDELVPLVFLAEALELPRSQTMHDHMQVILCDFGGSTVGLVCDTLEGKREIVIKPLGPLLDGVPCTAGATILGDRPIIILDIAATIARALHSETRSAPERAPMPVLSGNLLVVDDSEVIREAIRRMVSDNGFQVTVAVDGLDALDKAERQQFDLITTDVMMPRMDGYELTRALRALPNYRDIPIVMVTSRGERIDRIRGFDAGVDEYITKPNDRTLLLRTIRRLLGGET